MSRILKLKNKMNMKNLIKYGFIAVVSCFLLSCGSMPNKTAEENRELNTIVFEGCEYVYYFDKMAHKGNCKNPIHKCNCN